MAGPDLNHVKSVHLIGIGGTAMTPLATILLDMGVHVSGSDLSVAPSTAVLEEMGARVAIGHRAENVGADVELVVASSAIPEDNAEIQEARTRQIPVVKHSAALGSLMRGRRPIAIAGTHGKTTTSALMAVVLLEAGIDATFHVGSELLNFGRFGRLGEDDILVAEADEFDRRFLDYDPELAIVTSVEPDHLDYFGAFASVVDAFESFVARVRPGGAVVICADDEGAKSLATGPIRRITYGTCAEADWRLESYRPVSPTSTQLTVRGPGGEQIDCVLQLVGRHNALNATGVIAGAVQLGVTLPQAARGIAAFRGTRRRFEVKGTADGVTVVDDYAHHPTAIRATLEAARAHYRGEIWSIFQPHTAHRTQALFNDFLTAFGEADHLFLVPTYRPAGREEVEFDPSVAALAQALQHPDVQTTTMEAAAAIVGSRAQPGDLVLVMGAGDVWKCEIPLLQRLRDRSTE